MPLRLACATLAALFSKTMSANKRLLGRSRSGQQQVEQASSCCLGAGSGSGPGGGYLSLLATFRRRILPMESLNGVARRLR